MNNKKILGLFTIIALSILALSVFASAFTLPPVVSISASPNPSTLTSTITAIGLDLSGSGLEYIRIYESGVLVKQCATSTCVYLAFHASPGIRSYYAVASDNAGSASSSSTINVNFQNSAPILNLIGNKVINEGSLLMFAISGFDYNNDPLAYSAIGLPSGATLNPLTGAFLWTPSYSQSGIYPVTFSISDGTLTDSETISITVNNVIIPDFEAPRWFNLTVNPASPVFYSPSQVYEFNSTWTDNVSVSSVWIEFDGVNYTLSGVGSVYNFSRVGLPAGIHSYTWYANDVSGNLNKTATANYSVLKAVPALSLSILPSTSVASNIQTNVTGVGCPAQLTCTLYRSGVLVNNSDVNYLSDGTYNYVYNTTGNDNYTSTSVSSTLYVNSISPNGDDNNGGRTEIVSDSELNSGSYIYLDIDDKLKFNLCGSPYYITLTDIDSDDENAYFRLTPGIKSFVLGEGDREEFDLSMNDVNDVLFRVEKVDNSRVKVYIKRIVDACAATSIIDTTVTTNTLRERLNPLGKSSKLTYLMIWLMLGVLLAALAVLLILLSKSRRKR